MSGLALPLPSFQKKKSYKIAPSAAAPCGGEDPSADKEPEAKAAVTWGTPADDVPATSLGGTPAAAPKTKTPEAALWDAVRNEDARGVENALREGAQVDDTRDNVLTYKSRHVLCQPLHYAAALPGARAKDVVSVLLGNKADARAEASYSAWGERRTMQPIHFAAGTGTVDTIRLLLTSNADACAYATYGAEPEIHFQPIHDAAFYNRWDCVLCLHEHRAKLDATNRKGHTLVHIAAQQGHADIVRHVVKESCNMGRGALMEAQNLMKIKNRFGRTPLAEAVEGQQFPRHYLYLFTSLLDYAGKIDSFLKVIGPGRGACPDAAPGLLREEDLEISDEWRQSLLWGVQSERITVATLSYLVTNAPQVATDLIDALTTDPKVVNPEHNALPIRAKINDSSDVCCISCCYEKDTMWEWSPVEGSRRWHATLAPNDIRRGYEVKVKVIHMRGLLNTKLIHCIASSREQFIFTKFVVHGLIKYMWSRFRWMFLVDFTHECVAVAVTSYWIWMGSALGTHSRFLRCALWSLLASKGVMECFVFTWSGTRCLLVLGRRTYLDWLAWNWHRLLLGCSTLALAFKTSAEFYPGRDADTILAVNGLVHWLLMLFELRGFHLTGRQLLPIMKSVMPITGMIAVMLFIFMGFLHAFWALSRGSIGLVSFYQVTVLLFAGEVAELYVSSEAFAGMESQMQDIMVILCICSIFIFFTCSINVFIAVLGDCYDLEQERMVCTFLKERGKICSGYMLWPGLHVTDVLRQEKRWRKWTLCALFLGASAAAFALLVDRSTGRTAENPWLPALSISVCVFVLQAVLRNVLTEDWKERYLWICHDADIEEAMFLGPVERDLVEYLGRLARMKNYINEQCNAVSANSRSVEQAIKKVGRDLSKEIQNRTSRLKQLSVGLGFGPSAEMMPTPSRLRVVQRSWRAPTATPPSCPPSRAQPTLALAKTDASVAAELDDIKSAMASLMEKLEGQREARARLRLIFESIRENLSCVADVVDH